MPKPIRLGHEPRHIQLLHDLPGLIYAGAARGGISGAASFRRYPPKLERFAERIGRLLVSSMDKGIRSVYAIAIGDVLSG